MALVLPLYGDNTRTLQDIDEVGTTDTNILNLVTRSNENASSELESLFEGNIDFTVLVSELPTTNIIFLGNVKQYRRGKNTQRRGKRKGKNDIDKKIQTSVICSVITIMNYRVFTDTASPRLLSKFNKPIELKPQVGDVITIGIPLTPWVITREQTNTFGEDIIRITEDSQERISEDGQTRITEGENFGDNISFDFFVSVQNTTPDSVSLRQSNDNVQRKLNMFG